MICRIMGCIRRGKCNTARSPFKPVMRTGETGDVVLAAEMHAGRRRRKRTVTHRRLVICYSIRWDLFNEESKREITTNENLRNGTYYIFVLRPLRGNHPPAKRNADK